MNILETLKKLKGYVSKLDEVEKAIVGLEKDVKAILKQGNVIIEKVKSLLSIFKK